MTSQLFKPLRAAALVAAATPLLACHGGAATPAEAQSDPPNGGSAPGRASSESPDVSAAALHSAATDPAARHFYEKHGRKAAWSPAARQDLEKTLASRSAHGLDRIAFLKDAKSCGSPAEQEVAFTQAALAYEGIADKWQKARGGSDEQVVELPHNLPVRLLYRNVFVEDGGQIAFRTDPYAWNGPVAKALGFGDASSKAARAEGVDVGP